MNRHGGPVPSTPHCCPSARTEWQKRWGIGVGAALAAGAPDGARLSDPQSRVTIASRRATTPFPYPGILGSATSKSRRQEKNVAVEDVTVVSVPVSDQERAKAFYIDTLGFELVRDDDSVPRHPLAAGRTQGWRDLADPRDLVRVDARRFGARARASVRRPEGRL
jgi:hypothetical protein